MEGWKERKFDIKSFELIVFILGPNKARVGSAKKSPRTKANMALHMFLMNGDGHLGSVPRRPEENNVSNIAVYLLQYPVEDAGPEGAAQGTGSAGELGNELEAISHVTHACPYVRTYWRLLPITQSLAAGDTGYINSALLPCSSRVMLRWTSYTCHRLVTFPKEIINTLGHGWRYRPVWVPFMVAFMFHSTSNAENTRRSVGVFHFLSCLTALNKDRASWQHIKFSSCLWVILFCSLLRSNPLSNTTESLPSMFLPAGMGLLLYRFVI